MKRHLLAFLLLSMTVLGSAKIVASGPVKSFKGPEGEVITMVEVNDSKEMLVHMKGIGGEWDGKSVLYSFRDQGRGHKEVFTNKKRGSKSFESFLLTARDGQWRFYHPTKGSTEFVISYSEKDSEKMKLEDLLKAYKP